MVQLSTIDLVLVWGYLIGVVILGIWYGRRTTTAEGFWLAGRDLTWPWIGMSLWATHIDSADILGRVGGSYRDGVYTLMRSLLDAVVNAPLLALIFVPIYLRIGIVTTPEYLERRFNYASRFVFSCVNIINRAIMLSMVMFGGGLMFKKLMGWDVMFSVVVLAGLAGTYTIIGGLRSVIVTDMAQGILLMIGLIIMVPFALNFAGGWDAIVSNVKWDMLNPLPPVDYDLFSKRNAPFPIIIPMVFFSSYFFQNYELLQRVLAAKDVKNARRACMAYAGMTILFNTIMAFLAVVCLAKYKEIKPIDDALPQLMGDCLPPVIAGLGFVAIMASIMSTVDSIICGNATLFTRDIWQRLIRPKASDREILNTSRVVTLVLLFFAIWFSQYVPLFGGLWWLTTVINSVMSQVFATFVLGMFWPRCSPNAAFVGLLAGVAFSIWLTLQGFHPGYTLTFGLAANTIVTVIGSYFEPPPSPEKLEKTTAYEYEPVAAGGSK